MQSAQSLVDNGNEKWVSGEADAALALYDRALQLAPHDTAALSQKAAVLLTIGDLQGALTCHDELVSLDPSDHARRAARARVLAQLTRYDDAIADLNAALPLAAGAEDPARASLLKDKALYLRRSGQQSEAIATLTSHLGEDSTDGQLLVSLGDAQLDAGETDAAVRTFQRASRSGGSAFVATDWTVRGDRLYSAGRYEDAITLYLLGLTLDESAQAWKGLAGAYTSLPDFERGLEATTRALALEPDDSDTQNLHGSCLFNLGRWREAQEFFTRAAEIDPENMLAWYNQAIVLTNLDRLKDAMAAAARAVELDPSDVDSWSQLCMIQYRLGLFDDSLASARQGAQLDPDDIWAHSNAAAALVKLTQYDEALAEAEVAISIDPAEAQPWCNKADALLRLGRVEEALQTYDEALPKVTAVNVVYYNKAGLLSDDLGRHEEALDLLRLAVDMDPDDVSTACDYAEVLLKSKRYQEAIEAATQLLGRELSSTQRSAMLLVIYASEVLAGDTSHRPRAFEEFISHFCEHFGPDRDHASTWNFSGLRSMLRSGEASSENRFILETLADLQDERIGNLSFFTSPASR